MAEGVHAAQCRATSRQYMTMSLMMFGLWALVTATFVFGMTMKELDTNRARALRLEDSSLNSESVNWAGALGLAVAVLLCLLGR